MIDLDKIAEKKKFIEKLKAVRQNSINKGMDTSTTDRVIKHEEFSLWKMERQK